MPSHHKMVAKPEAMKQSRANLPRGPTQNLGLLSIMLEI